MEKGGPALIHSLVVESAAASISSGFDSAGRDASLATDNANDGKQLEGRVMILVPI